MKLDKTGKLAYSTYLDQSEKTRIHALAVNTAGALYAAGSTDGLTFPTSAQSYIRSVPADIDRSQNAVGFIAQLKPDGSGLVSSTLLGGTYDHDSIVSLAIAPDGPVYAGGNAFSTNFPFNADQMCLSPCPRSYLAKFDANTSHLLSAVPAGGDGPPSVAVDGQGAVWVVAIQSNGILLARLDSHNPQAPGLFVPVTNGSVRAITILPNGHLVVAGVAQRCYLMQTVDAIMPCRVYLPHDPKDTSINAFDGESFVMEFGHIITGRISAACHVESVGGA